MTMASANPSGYAWRSIIWSRSRKSANSCCVYDYFTDQEISEHPYAGTNNLALMNRGE
jgi:hypothetical protein